MYRRPIVAKLGRASQNSDNRYAETDECATGYHIEDIIVPMSPPTHPVNFGHDRCCGVAGLGSSARPLNYHKPDRIAKVKRT